MWDGERVHKHVVDFETRAGFKQVAVEPGLQLEFKGFFCGAVAVNRNVELLGDSSQAVNMVAVFVCDEDGGKVFRRATDARKAAGGSGVG